MSTDDVYKVIPPLYLSPRKFELACRRKNDYDSSEDGPPVFCRFGNDLVDDNTIPNHLNPTSENLRHLKSFTETVIIYANYSSDKDYFKARQYQMQAIVHLLFERVAIVSNF